MSAPPIGVVIPAFNRETTVERAVRSALEQTVRPARVVVVDDGSTDSTAERVRTMGSAVELLTQPNAGASAARNRGVDALSTTWVAFLDSDDVWDATHLERIGTAIAETDGSADLYFDDAAAEEFPDGVTLWSLSGFEVHDAPVLTDDATDWVLLPLQPIAIQSAVIRRTRYRELGGMWTELSTREDTHLIFRLGLGRPACAVPGVGARLTADGGQSTRLTSIAGPGSVAYSRCSVRLYRDLLDRCPPGHDPSRARLTELLVDAEIADASLRLRRRDPGGAVAWARAARKDPATTLRRTLSAMRRGRSGPAAAG